MAASPLVRPLLLLFGILLSACAAAEGCDTDLDCKADRVCEERVCVDRPAPRAPVADLQPLTASSLQVCRAGCDARQRCGLVADAAPCRAECDAMRDGMDQQDAADDARCVAAAQARHALLDCNQRECSQIASCVQRVGRACP